MTDPIIEENTLKNHQITDPIIEESTLKNHQITELEEQYAGLEFDIRLLEMDIRVKFEQMTNLRGQQEDIIAKLTSTARRQNLDIFLLKSNLRNYEQ